MREGRSIALCAMAAAAAAITSAAAPRAAPAAPQCGWHVPLTNMAPGEWWQIEGIAALAPGDVWFVGRQGDRSPGWRPLIVHYDGRDLRRVPTPNPNGFRDGLRAVTARTTDAMWAVGDGRNAHPTTMYFNGTRWRMGSGFALSDSGDEALSLRDVATAWPAVWAVGSELRSGRRAGRAQVRGKLGWRHVETPPTGGLDAVVAPTVNDIWLFGSGPERTGLRRLRRDGARWDVAAPTRYAGRAMRVHDASASGPRDIWVVGSAGGRPWAERYDGAAWRESPLPESHWRRTGAAGTVPTLRGVKAWSGSDVWAVGSFGIEHYDGRRWQLVETSGKLSAIDGASPREMWAAGEIIARYTCL